MTDLIVSLKESIEDSYFSKSEKSSLKSMLARQPLDAEMINLLRSKILDLANERLTNTNYRLIMQWVKDVNHLLQSNAAQSSRAYFSPGDDCRNVIIRQMNLSLRRLNICVFTISDDQISQAIIDAHAKGVSVRIITDNDKVRDHGSDIDRLHHAGIDIKIDASRNHMHHKFMITDDHSLITGSYNWTVSAARFNHENILLTREQGVVTSYQNGFNQLWKEMADYA
jgi:phosphatidylserine/phosphatidylglycerophosphate/cardiolipin synthase-like enzyme